MREAVRCRRENRAEENPVALFGIAISAERLTHAYLLCRRIENISQRIAQKHGLDNAPFLFAIKTKFGELRIQLEVCPFLRTQIPAFVDQIQYLLASAEN